MKLPGRCPLSRLVVLMTCNVLLAVVLVACGGGNTASTPTPTPKPSPTATATQTPLPAVGTTTYKGNGFTLTYVQGWNATAVANTVEFADSTNAYHFDVTVTPNATGISASTLLSAEIQGVKTTLKNVKTVNGPPTAMIGGDTWQQETIEGTPTSGGETTPVEIVFASDNHPSNKTSSTNFTIFYGTDTSQMHAADTVYFQQMIDSFTFTS